MLSVYEIGDGRYRVSVVAADETTAMWKARRKFLAVRRAVACLEVRGAMPCIEGECSEVSRYGLRWGDLITRQSAGYPYRKYSHEAMEQMMDLEGGEA